MKKNFAFCDFLRMKDLLSRKNLLSIAYSEYLVPSIIRPNFDFFLTEINLSINHYYFIVPYYVSVSKKIRDKFEINDSINLQLNNVWDTVFSVW